MKISVSIIMPCYNSAAFVDRALDSVLNQTYGNWELIIIDDASKDDTTNIVRKYESKYPEKIRLILNETNLGADKTRNLGIKAAKGQYLAFLDSDDYWLENKLFRQVNFMSQTSSFFSCTEFFVDQRGNRTHKGIKPTLSRNDLLKNNRVCTSTVIFDRDKLGGLLMPSIRKGQDLAFWLTLIRETVHVDVIKEPLTVYFKHEDSLSHDKLDSARWVWKLYRDFENMDIIRASYFFACYALNGVVKHYID